MSVRTATTAQSSSAGGMGDAPQSKPANEEAEKQARVLKARYEDQAGEIARLKAALAVFENSVDADGATPLRDSRIGVKARMQSLEAQTVQQADAILRLRSDLAAANERLARQANHFTNELKRLGGGTNGANGYATRRTADAGQRFSLTERVLQTRAVPEAIVAHAELVPVAAQAAGDPKPPVGELIATPRDAPAAPNMLQLDPSLDPDNDARPRLLDRIASLGRN